MPGRFTVAGPTEIRYNLTSPEAYQPTLYIGGDTTSGFFPSRMPERLGFWGTTFRDKQINAATREAGNATTFVFNKLIDPLVPGEQRFVSLGAGMLMRQQLTGERETINGWKALSNRFSPVQNVAELDKVLLFEDENFDPSAATDEWLTDQSNTTLAQLANREGFDLEHMLRHTRNLEHFVYTQNRILAHAQAMQNIRQWEEQAGFAVKWSSRIASGVGNYLLTDPSFAPSLFIGPGSLNTAGKSLTIGSKVTRLSAPVVGGSKALALGRAAARLAEAPAAVHAGLATALGHRAAVAVELGAYGGLWDVAFQAERIEQSQIVFDDPQHQEHWSWAELGLASGLGATLGFALAGRGGRSVREMRKAAAEAAGASSAHPIAHSFDHIRASGLFDSSAIRVQRAAASVLGDDLDAVAPYLDDALLHDHGLHRFQIADAMEQLAEALGGQQIPPAAVHRVLGDMLTEAKKVRGLRTELISKFDDQLEQVAVAEALGRAARELDTTASNAQVLQRAYELVPEELNKQQARLELRASQARAAAEDELQYWQDEAASLIQTAKLRTLTEAEIDHMGTVGGKLRSLGVEAPFEGMATNRAARYMDGTIFAPFRSREGTQLTKAVSKAFEEQRTVQELLAARDIGQDVTAPLKAARMRLARARATLERVAADETAVDQGGLPARRVREVLAKWNDTPPTTRAEKARALDEVAAALDLNASALLEDGTMIGRLLTGWGLGDWLRRIAQSGTGIDQTVRSKIAILRELAHEFDSSKLRVGHIDPSRNTIHRSLEDVRLDVQVRASEIVDGYARLHRAGKFGSSINVIRYGRSRRDFDRQVIRHITGSVRSDDADVQAMAALWKKHADQIGEVGHLTGQLDRVENFFPRRWNVGAVLKDEGRFREALSNFFLRKWEASDDVHLDTLVQMGAAERVLDEAGNLRGWKLNGQERVIRTLKRSELGEINEDGYLAALREVGDDGFTPMQRSANKAKNNLLGDDSFEELPNGRLRRKRAGAPRSEADRRIEEEAWLDSELEEFLDWRLLHGVEQYMRSTGFRILNTARHQERWGIPNLTMQDTLDWLETRIPATASADENKMWMDGLKTLREKLYLAEGRLPTLKDQTNRLGEWLGDVGVSLAGSLYGSGIGQAVLTTEAMLSVFARVYDPTDFVRRIGQIFKVAVPNHEMREQIQALGLTIRHHRLHTMERLTGGSLHSEGFQFGVVPKLLTPWMDVFDTSVRALPGQGNRTAAALRAHAATSMTVGGMDYFTQFSRMLHVQSILDETGRFFKAAEKTAVLLQDSTDELRKIEQSAVRKALDAGKTDEVARAAGARARFKAWRGIVRKGGFGGNWQVAERMNRAGLLNPERLAVLRTAGQTTGALRDTGLFKSLDFNELMRFTGRTQAEQDLFEDAFTSLRNSIRHTIDKRVSEQNLLQTPTSQTSRTWLGRTQLAMTSFARSWYDNNILDMAQMPARAAVAMIGMYLFGETMNRILRDVWRGRSIDETLADIEADPDNFIARTMTNIPVLGAWSALARPAADALTLDGRRQRVDTGESAAEGAIGSTLDVVFDTVHGVSPLAEDSEIQTRTWRTAAMFLPGYRSWWATSLLTGLEAAGGPSLAIEGKGRNRVVRRPRTSIDPIPEPLLEELETEPKFPEDLSFIYPQE
jgi:hypothetical protein